MKSINALIHNSLPDGDLVEPLSQSDKDCFQEIREVLQSHGKLERFGITLLHKHFDIADDEMLVENIDEVTRTQIIAPMKKEAVTQSGGQILETMWALYDGEVLMGCKRACVLHAGHHTKRHVHTGTN